MIFINNTHKEKFLYLNRISNIHENDIERISLFYIISGNEKLHEKRDLIYDFDENTIKTECLYSDNTELTPSLKTLIRMGFNLYNGYVDEKMNLLWMLALLDSHNFTLLMHAIFLRLDKTSYIKKPSSQ